MNNICVNYKCERMTSRRRLRCGRCRHSKIERCPDCGTDTNERAIRCKPCQTKRRNQALANRFESTGISRFGSKRVYTRCNSCNSKLKYGVTKFCIPCKAMKIGVDMKGPKICVMCEKEYYGKVGRSKTCSHECSMVHRKQYLKSRNRPNKINECRMCMKLIIGHGKCCPGDCSTLHQSLIQREYRKNRE